MIKTLGSFVRMRRIPSQGERENLLGEGKEEGQEGKSEPPVVEAKEREVKRTERAEMDMRLLRDREKNLMKRLSKLDTLQTMQKVATFQAESQERKAEQLYLKKKAESKALETEIRPPDEIRAAEIQLAPFISKAGVEAFDAMRREFSPSFATQEVKVVRRNLQVLSELIYGKRDAELRKEQAKVFQNIQATLAELERELPNTEENRALRRFLEPAVDKWKAREEEMKHKEEEDISLAVMQGRGFYNIWAMLLHRHREYFVREWDEAWFTLQMRMAGINRHCANEVDAVTLALTNDREALIPSDFIRMANGLCYNMSRLIDYFKDPETGLSNINVSPANPELPIWTTPEDYKHLVSHPLAERANLAAFLKEKNLAALASGPIGAAIRQIRRTANIMESSQQKTNSDQPEDDFVTFARGKLTPAQIQRWLDVRNTPRLALELPDLLLDAAEGSTDKALRLAINNLKGAAVAELVHWLDELPAETQETLRHLDAFMWRSLHECNIGEECVMVAGRALRKFVNLFPQTSAA